MARKARDTKEPMYTATLTLDASTKAVLAAIRYKNASEAARYLIRYAIQHGALAPYLNADGTLKTPAAPRKPGTLPKGERVYVGKRLDPNDPAFAGWDDDSPLPQQTQVVAPPPAMVFAVPATTLDANGIPDDYDGDDWSDLIKPAPQPAQPTTQAHTAGYKPATDADMRALMMDIEQSLK